MKRLLAMLLSAALLLPIMAFGDTSRAAGDVGLSIVAPSGATLRLHKGAMKRSTTVSTTDNVTATSKSTANGQTTYFFKDLAAGIYHYTLQRTGYYTVFQNVWYSEEESQTGRTVTAATMHKKNGNGFEPPAIQIPAQGMLDNILITDPDTWGPEYAQIFTTPYFLRDKSVSGMHQQTTHQEMLDFINGLAAENDNMYVLHLGTSPKYGYEMPLVVFSKEDLNGKTMEEIAEIFKANSKPTLHFEGQIHSNEPGGGEVTLAFIKQMAGDYGDGIMDAMDVYFIPRVNPDGAYNWTRTSAQTGDDMNRDFMAAKNKEVQTVISVYNMFRPEVTVCTHEMYLVRTERATRMEDVDASMSSPARSLPEAAELSMEILELMRRNVEAKGLRIATYADYAYSANMLVDNGYLGSRGSIGVLTETLGILAGTGWYERRIAASYTVIKTLFDYVAEHPAQVVDLVRRNREDLIARGAVYDEDDMFIVSQSASRSGPVWAAPTIDQYTGQITDPDATYTNYIPTPADIKIARVRPTAYLVPMDLPQIDEITRILDVHDIKWYELPAGSTVRLKQYVMASKPATLTEEKTVSFPAGACVATMDQDTANVLGMFMEPDSIGHQTSDVPGNVADLQLVTKAADGTLPVYRYCHDLVDGKIPMSPAPELTAVQPASEFGTGAVTGFDPARAYEYRAAWEDDYTPVPAGATELTGLGVGTYYVHFADVPGQEAQDCAIEIVDAHATSFAVYLSDGGSDANDGRAEDRPVKTLKAAYAKLAGLMRTAQEGTEGKVIFVGTVTLSGDTKLPANDFPVVLTGLTPAAGLRSSYDIFFSGDTKLENMTLTLGTAALHHLYAEGNRLEIGEGVTSAATGGYYYNLVGGGIAAMTGDTDLIVRSGTWRHIYAAGYKQPLTGDAHLTVTGGNVTYQIQASYSGGVNGSVTMDLSGVAVAGEVYGASANTGDVTGDVTVTLGEGLTAKAAYGGSKTKGGVTGTATLILDGAQLGILNGGCANTASTVGSSAVILKSGSCPAGVTAGQLEIDTSAGGQVELPASLTVDRVTGGGTVRLPAGQELTVTGSVTGATAVLLDGTPEDGAVCVNAGAAVPADAFTGAGTLRLTSSTDASGRHWAVSASAGTPGDLTGDDKVNAKDIVLLQRFVAGGYGVTLGDEADLTGDGKVNAKDIVLLQRFVAGGYGVTL